MIWLGSRATGLNPMVDRFSALLAAHKIKEARAYLGGMEKISRAGWMRLSRPFAFDDAKNTLKDNLAGMKQVLNHQLKKE